MPEWKRAIEERLSGARIDAARRLEIVDELSQHLQDRYDELRAGGASDEAARAGALAELDDRHLVGELTRIERPPPEPLPLGGGSKDTLVSGLWQDLRFGARLLLKDWGASLVIVVTLALAIAANAIVFGFADLLLFRPLPIPTAPRVVEIYGVDRRQGRNRESVSIPDYLDIKAQSGSFAAVSAMTRAQLSLIGAGEPIAVTAEAVTPNLFEVWKLQATAGRTLQADDDRAGQRDVVVLAHHFWAAHFAADPAVLGRAITLNGRRRTIVGVLTPAIEIGNLGRIDVWVPLETDAGAKRDDRVATIMALLRPGATPEAANVELAAIGARLQEKYPVTNADRDLRGMTLRESIAGGSTWIIVTLLGVVVGLVLMAACANVATVMLARASARRRELAIRVALGATRVRLARQLLSEGLLLGLVSGACGLLLAHGGLAGFKSLSAERYFQLLQINANLLAFALVLSIVAPIVFGVVPALHSSCPHLNEDLKDGGRDASSSQRGNRSRAILVVAQVAFALIVLVVSGLIVRTVDHLKRAPLGVTARGLLTTRVRFDPPEYEDDDQRLRAVKAILDRLGESPGVAAAAAMSGLPILDGEGIRQFAVAGRPLPQQNDLPWAFEATAMGDYARTFGFALVDGRLFRAEDRSSSWNVAVVNREAARRYWPGQTAIGQYVTFVGGSPRPAGDAVEIVGVVDNVIGSDVTQPPPPRVYRPLAAGALTSVVFAVRASGDPATLAGTIREVFRIENRDLAVSEVQLFGTQLSNLRRSDDLIIALFGGFAAIGFIVAITGVYGVTAFAVGQRRHEIGVRLALGATAAGVVALIMAGGFRLIAVGVVLGLFGGWAIGLTMRNILFGVGAIDPVTYLVVLGLVAAGAFVATYLPAHRVTSIDPAVVLKRE